MSGDVTIGALQRQTYLPDRDASENGLLIAGQYYYDVNFTGGEISGITLSNLTSPLAIADGGTGQNTANAALNALLPTQGGNSGKSLVTDGTNTSWVLSGSGTVTSVGLSGGTTGLTVSGSPITTSGTITLGGTLSPANGGTGIANNAASTLAISGNFATTLTVTGATGVTLPTTGTLATRAGTETLTNKTITGATNVLGIDSLNGATGTGKLLRANGTNWVASTATYPDTATGTGTILRANGTNWLPSTATYPDTTTINQLLYSSSANTIAGLATVNGGILNAGATGIPALTVTPTLGVAGTSKGTISLSGNTSGVVTIQPAAAAGTYTLTLPTDDGATNQFLKTDGSGVLSWSDTTQMMTGFTGTVSSGNIAAGTTNYLVINGYVASEGGSRQTVPTALKITAMYLIADNTPGGAQTYTYTLFVNGGASAMTCTTTGAANASNTTSNPQTLAAGDTFSIRIVTSGTATAASHKWAIAYTTP